MGRIWKTTPYLFVTVVNHSRVPNLHLRSMVWSLTQKLHQSAYVFVFCHLLYNGKGVKYFQMKCNSDYVNW